MVWKQNDNGLNKTWVGGTRVQMPPTHSSLEFEQTPQLSLVLLVIFTHASPVGIAGSFIQGPNRIFTDTKFTRNLCRRPLVLFILAWGSILFTGLFAILLDAHGQNLIGAHVLVGQLIRLFDITPAISGVVRI